MLLQHAGRLGVKIYEGIDVTQVDFLDGHPPRIAFKMGQKEVKVRVKMVVDASGRHTFLGIKNWYKFISLYYRLNVMFTYIVRDERYRLDILQLLQGDVYDREPEVLRAMEKMIKEVEEDTSHPWHRALGELGSETFKTAIEAPNKIS